ncbi:hypothetical protein Bca52824_073731 [Brassica carinata]|uniref:Uncharacterized protein n=1 Tax=Brassica carinata TaxID=52824 RepID=A0A8X7QC59_BRACI|nr:hypothetical protein Bca52824_073731 [Brassica carinata]
MVRQLVQGRRLIASELRSPSNKQHRICCWFRGKVVHKVECFAHEKSRNMAKKVNKMFIKPKRVEEVLLAKSGLLDEVKEETSKKGASRRSDLEVDQEASSLSQDTRMFVAQGEGDLAHQEVMRDDLRRVIVKSPKTQQRVQGTLVWMGKGSWSR